MPPAACASRREPLALFPRVVAHRGYRPQVKPAFWAIVLFRWDINVRESAVLGLVGAGGVGMALDTALNLLQWDPVAMILVAIFAVVIVAEIVVTGIRRRMIRAAAPVIREAGSCVIC
jgi:ABC-type phosphate/phosphonate transport system permease subunit